MEPFATLEDLKARWPDMPAGSDTHAQVLLTDATDYIIDIVPTAIKATEATRRRITCAVVRRVMEAAQTQPGLTEYSETTGPFSVSYKPSETAMYLRKDERKALGAGARAFGIHVAGYAPNRVQHAPSCATWYGLENCDCPAMKLS